MVLRLKARKSRSSPSLAGPPSSQPNNAQPNNAGWSSPVARQAHNLKVEGSNPSPATNSTPEPPRFRRFSLRARGSSRNRLSGISFGFPIIRMGQIHPKGTVTMRDDDPKDAGPKPPF